MTFDTYTHRPHLPEPDRSSFHRTCEASLRLSQRSFPADTQTRAARTCLLHGLPLHPTALDALRRSLVSSMALVESGKVTEPHLSLDNLDDALATLRALRCQRTVSA